MTANGIRASQKQKRELLADAAVPVLLTYPKKRKSLRQLHSHADCGMVHGSPETEAARVSISAWDKGNVAHTPNRALFSHKKDKILSHVTKWMNPEDIT